MNKLSFRHTGGIETPSGGGGIGVSTGVRKYWRKFYASVPNMLGPNDQINYIIAMDYSGAEPLHRFILRSGEPCEIRKSGHFYYLAVIRKNKRHDVISIQPSVKAIPPEVSKSRMSDDWLEKVFRGEIKRRIK